MELVRETKYLIIGEPGGDRVVKVGVVPPAPVEAHRFSHQVRVAESESAKIGRLARSAAAEDERDFVNGQNGDEYRSVLVREGEHRRVSKVWLRAKNALRFRASQLGAAIAGLERQKAPYDVRVRCGVDLREAPRQALLYLRPLDVEGRPRVYFDAGYDLALAGDLRPFQTLTHNHCRARERQRQRNQTNSEKSQRVIHTHAQDTRLPAR